MSAGAGDPSLVACIAAVKAALSSAKGLDVNEAAAGICGAVNAASSPIAAKVQGVADGLNTVLLLYGGAMVFLMHGGFAMVRRGDVETRRPIATRQPAFASFVGCGPTDST